MPHKPPLETLQQLSKERHGFIEENPFQYLVKKRIVVKGSGWKDINRGRIDWIKLKKAAIAR